jgi:hypothetical protein
MCSAEIIDLLEASGFEGGLATDICWCILILQLCGCAVCVCGMPYGVHAHTLWVCNTPITKPADTTTLYTCVTSTCNALRPWVLMLASSMLGK